MRKYFVWSEPHANGQPVRLIAGELEKCIARLLMGGKQGLHLGSHSLLDAHLIQIIVAFVRRSFQSAGEHRLHLLPSFRLHALVSLFFISRCRRARAVAHSRFRVAGAVPSTTEVFSTACPPKNGSSTTRGCW